MVELLLRFADRSRACHREVRRYSVILNYNTVVKRKRFLWASRFGRHLEGVADL